MKMALLLLGFLTLAAQAQVTDKSIQMSNVLRASGITGSGKREWMDALINCKVPKKTGVLQCELRWIWASGDVKIFKIYKGTAAQQISNLLTELGEKPTGRRSRQEALVYCENIKGTTIPDCRIDDSLPMMI